MNTVRGNAYAKLNLSLDITGVKDGYHQLDTLVCTVDLFDKIIITKRKDALVKLSMHGGGEDIFPEENNAYRAATAFVKAFGTCGAEIKIYKNIPIGAGMGGSSADAAGVLRLMAQLYGVRDQAAVKALADENGSDTGYLLTGGFARLTGRGEIIEPLGDLGRLNFLVLLPKEGVSTPRCFKAYDEGQYNYTPRTPQAVEALQRGNLREGAKYFFNALYESAASLNPAVREALTDLKCFSPLGAGMTGSGSGCFALFESAELCEWAKSRYTGACRAAVLKSVKGV